MDETLNPTKLHSELVLKPIIRELVRTQVCFPNLKLLVDRISIVTLLPTEQSNSNKAYRLHLTDGEKTIQAVLKRKIHKYIFDLDVRGGTYIILKTYRLARAKKLSGRGDVAYIIVEDFYPIGEEQRDDDEIKTDRYTELIKTPQSQLYMNLEEDYGGTKRRIFGSLANKSQEGNDVDKPGFLPDDSTPESLKDYNVKDKNTVSRLCQAEIPPLSPNASSPNPSRKRHEPFEEIDPNLTPRPSKFPKLDQSPIEAKQLTKTSSNSKFPYSTSGNLVNSKNLELSKSKPHGDINDIEGMVQLNDDVDRSKTNSACKDTKKPENSRLISPFNTISFPSPHKSTTIDRQKALLPIKRPLNIRSLDSVTGRHASRNKVYDFFAVVLSVDESVVKPPAMPLKRDIRIADPSVDKKVTVSVFVDPNNFQPAAGTIALFRSLTTHEWDHGMLNAYPQQCEGKDWFIVDPVGIEGCDLPGLRDWWKKKFAETEQKPGQGG